MLSLDKDNRMMGSMGSQAIFFKEDAKDALKPYHFTEKEIEYMLNNGFVLREEAMSFEYRYTISSVSVFNVERSKNTKRP